MFIEREARQEAKGLSDLIDHFAVVDDGVVLTKTGLFVAGFEFVGLDMDALPPEECWAIAHRLAGKLNLGSAWTVGCDLIRAPHAEYCPEAQWPDPVSHLIEQERRNRFRMEGEAATRLSRYFLSLSYEPALHGGNKVARNMFAMDGQGREGPGDKALALFKKRLSEIELLLQGNLSGVRRLALHSGRNSRNKASLRLFSAVRAPVHYRRRLPVCLARPSSVPQSISCYRRLHRRSRTTAG